MRRLLAAALGALLLAPAALLAPTGPALAAPTELLAPAAPLAALAPAAPLATPAPAALLAAPGPAARALAAPGPADAPEYWFDQWQVPKLWLQGAQGQGMTIAEIDTGVNAQLPELAGRVLAGKDFGQPGDGRVDRQQSEFGHGTAMASIMVGRRGTLGITGLAPGAQVLPIALPLSGTTDASANDHLPDAIRWAADHGAKIISMSLGGTRTPAADSVPCPTPEQDAIYYALSKGAVLLAASGNQGTQGSPVEEPGVCLGVLAVGAVDSSGAVASFSSRQPYLSLVAPGVDIASLSRVPGLAYSGDGTSQATAIASAVVALVWSAHPSLTGRQVVARVLATLANKRATRDPAYGYGRLDAYAAVTASVPADAPNPVYAAAEPFAARALAPDTPPKPPAAAATAARSVLGRFSVGHAPRLLAPWVLAGAAIALAGLLGLLALGVVAVRSRRRVAGRHVPTGSDPGLGAPAGPDPGFGAHAGADAGADAEPSELVGPSRPDEDGVRWHVIVETPTDRPGEGTR